MGIQIKERKIKSLIVNNLESYSDENSSDEDDEGD